MIDIRVRRFLISLVILITFLVLLAFLCLVEMSPYVLSILLFALGLVSIMLFGLGLRLVFTRLSTGVVMATPDELRREDDVLLQAVAFSQSLLFFLVNVTIEEEKTKLFLSISTAAFASAFYVLRAFGKIKESQKFRYYSMYVLALVLGNTTLIVLYSLMNHFMLLQSVPFFPHVLLSLLFSGVTGVSVREFVKEVFKKRYGYE